jgi:hypothetical protein
LSGLAALPAGGRREDEEIVDTTGTPEDGTRQLYADVPGPAGEPGEERVPAPGGGDAYDAGWAADRPFGALAGGDPADDDMAGAGYASDAADAADAGQAGGFSATVPGSLRWPSVVGPTPALRGFPGGPGIEQAAEEPVGTPAAQRRGNGGSLWQQAQAVWRDSGVAWQHPAADPQAGPAEWERVETVWQPPVPAAHEPRGGARTVGGKPAGGKSADGKPASDVRPRGTGTRRRGVGRAALAAAAVVTAAAALAAVGFVIAGGTGSGHKPAGGPGPRSPYPAARIADADFTTSPSLAARGIFQSLTAVNSYGATVVAAGEETGTRIARTQFFVSADSGRTWRLAPVTGPPAGAPAAAAVPVTIAGGPAGWVALAPGMSWTSNTGRSWQQAPAGGVIAPPGSGDQVLTAAATGGGFFAAGGAVQGGNPATASPVTWTSPDGVHWQRTGSSQLGLSVPGGTVHQIVYAAAHDGDLVIAADVTKVVRTGKGRTRRTRRVSEVDLWHSIDGGHSWAPAQVPVSDGAVNSVSGLATSAAGFVAVRPGSDKTAGPDAVAYTSARGGTWSYAAKITAPGKGGLRPVAVGGSSQGAAMGAIAAGGRLTAYQSKDGRSWREAGIPGAAAAALSGQSLAGLAVTPGGVVAAGTTPAAGAAGGTGAQSDGEQGFLAVAGAGTPVDLAAIPGDLFPQQAVNAVAAGQGLDVAVGSANGRPAVWVAAPGGAWSPAVGATAAVFGRQGLATLSGVTAGGDGWLAVGGPVAGAPPHPIVVSSADGRTWRTMDGAKAFAVPGATTNAAASDGRGYVIVGDRLSHGHPVAAAWWSPGPGNWNPAGDAHKGALEGSGAATSMLAVTAGPSGYVAVGADGASPAVWTSPDGRAWRLADLPVPPGAGSAVLRYVTVSGGRIVVAGTVAGTAGTAALFAVSADGGNTWAQTQVPLPGGNGAITGLTSTASGFVAAATAGAPGAFDVVVLRSADATAWQRITLAGTGLSGPGVQEITALTTSGGNLLGAGFTATQVAEHPTLWIAPPAPVATAAPAR